MKQVYKDNTEPVIYIDTDSAYINYQPILDTIVGADNWTDEQKRDFIHKINVDFLDQDNTDFMNKYFDERHVDSIHKFELETIAKTGVWINAKKRYAQKICWKDGKLFDFDKLPLKVKGLEIVKYSSPKASREILKNMVDDLLSGKENIHELNKMIQRYKTQFYEAPIDDICGTVKVNNYSKYVTGEGGKQKMSIGTPYQVKAIAKYNELILTKKLAGEPVYSGKIKVYKYRLDNKGKNIEYFGYPPGEYPEWGPEHIPIDKGLMFKSTVLDPFNRILEGISYPLLCEDGSIDIDLFSGW